MSFGGVIGGCFTALAAPMLFNSVIEYPILILAAVLVRPQIFAVKREEWLREGAFIFFLATALIVPFFLLAPQLRLGYFGVAAIVMAAFVALQVKNTVRLIGLSTILFLITNFYSPSQNMSVARPVVLRSIRWLCRRTASSVCSTVAATTHGAERVRGTNGKPVTGRPEPLSYYYRGGAISEAIDAARQHAGGAAASPVPAAVWVSGMGALSLLLPSLARTGPSTNSIHSSSGWRRTPRCFAR